MTTPPAPGTPEDKKRFDELVAKTITNEGGFAKHVATGEVVNFGITLTFLKAIQPSATEHDIREMTRAGAEYLYYEYFWTKPDIWRLSSDALAFRIMDLGVNCGPSVAIRLLQRAINAMGIDLKVDGVLGPRTAEIANAILDVPLLNEVKAQARARYKALATMDARHEPMLAGWLARLERA